MNVNQLSLSELGEYKVYLKERSFEYGKLKNLCDEILQTINEDNMLVLFYNFKSELNVFCEEIDTSFKSLNKRLKSDMFVSKFLLMLKMIKDFSTVKQYICEEHIEEADERLLSIGSEIFTIISNPKEDANYQAKKKKKQDKREQFYKEFKNKYMAKETKRFLNRKKNLNLTLDF